MITIKKYDTNPISEIGEIAGICWGADTSNQEKNYKRGLECIENNHGRVMEFTSVQIIIDEYSARVMRELYTHIIGTSRLQESTRYVDKSNFGYFTPPSIENNSQAKEIYDDCMENIKEVYKSLLALGIKKEDIGGILPLNSNSKMVLQINLRALIHLFEMRMCTRAYIEFRQLMIELKKQLSQLSDEWKYLCDNVFVPKCKNQLYCEEKYTCGLMPKKEEVKTLIDNLK